MHLVHLLVPQSGVRDRGVMAMEENADDASQRRAAARERLFEPGPRVVYVGHMVDWREVVVTTPDEDVEQ